MSTRLSVYGVCLLGEIDDHAREGVRAFLGTGKSASSLGFFPTGGPPQGPCPRPPKRPPPPRRRRPIE